MNSSVLRPRRNTLSEEESQRDDGRVFQAREQPQQEMNVHRQFYSEWQELANSRLLKASQSVVNRDSVKTAELLLRQF